MGLRSIAALLALSQCALAEDLIVGTERLGAELAHHEDFEGPARRWRYDGRGLQWIEDGRLHMDAGRFECTAWFTQEMEGDVAILYQARILQPGADNNINLIFLATGPDGGDVLAVPFTGAYDEYHRLPNYIFTFTRTHSRLRRDPGFQILSENRSILPEPGRVHQFVVLVQQGKVRCFVDERLVHSYQDAAPLRKGKLAFRTFRTRLWWDNLRVYRLREEP